MKLGFAGSAGPRAPSTCLPLERIAPAPKSSAASTRPPEQRASWTTETQLPAYATLEELARAAADRSRSLSPRRRTRMPTSACKRSRRALHVFCEKPFVATVEEADACSLLQPRRTGRWPSTTSSARSRSSRPSRTQIGTDDAGRLVFAQIWQLMNLRALGRARGLARGDAEPDAVRGRRPPRRPAAPPLRRAPGRRSTRGTRAGWTRAERRTRSTSSRSTSPAAGSPRSRSTGSARPARATSSSAPTASARRCGPRTAAARCCTSARSAPERPGSASSTRPAALRGWSGGSAPDDAGAQPARRRRRRDGKLFAQIVAAFQDTRAAGERRRGRVTGCV